MKLVAVEEFYFDNKTRRVGDIVDASVADAAFLKGIGKVKDAPKPEVAKATQKVEEPVAEPSPPVEQPVSEEPKRHRYRRRDVTAEE